MSGHEHLNDSVLLDALYGLTDIKSDLRQCAACTARWDLMRRKRASLAEAGEISSDFLAAQRREIHARLSQQSSLMTGPAAWLQMPARWAPAVAVLCLLVIGVFFYSPSKVTVTPAPTASTELSDAQVFADISDVYALDRSFEPSAAVPMHALFEEGN